ncbi:hypothetical protein FM106_09590 [Brachybacterium faecium]|nr:hypothetical protein FM106_09590 [Brachybacterium faecium]
MLRRAYYHLTTFHKTSKAIKKTKQTAVHFVFLSTYCLLSIL